MAAITFYGRLTRDPEVRQVGDKSVCRFAVADGDDFYAGPDAEPQSLYLECEVWGRRGEVMPQLAGKGDRIYFTGKLRPNNYTDKNGREVRSSFVRGDYILVETKADRERKAAASQGGGSYGGGYGNDAAGDEIPF